MSRIWRLRYQSTIVWSSNDIALLFSRPITIIWSAHRLDVIVLIPCFYLLDINTSGLNGNEGEVNDTLKISISDAAWHFGNICTEKTGSRNRNFQRLISASILHSNDALILTNSTLAHSFYQIKSKWKWTILKCNRLD